MEIQAKMKRHRFEKGDVKRKKKSAFTPVKRNWCEYC